MGSIKKCSECKHGVAEAVVFGDRSSDSYLEFGCMLEEDPRALFVMEGPTDCPLWEESDMEE